MITMVAIIIIPAPIIYIMARKSKQNIYRFLVVILILFFIILLFGIKEIVAGNVDYGISALIVVFASIFFNYLAYDFGSEKLDRGKERLHKKWHYSMNITLIKKC